MTPLRSRARSFRVYTSSFALTSSGARPGGFFTDTVQVRTGTGRAASTLSPPPSAISSVSSA